MIGTQTITLSQEKIKWQAEFNRILKEWIQLFKERELAILRVCKKNKIPLNEIAKEMGITRSMLYRRYKEVYGEK